MTDGLDSLVESIGQFVELNDAENDRFAGTVVQWYNGTF